MAPLLGAQGVFSEAVFSPCDLRALSLRVQLPGCESPRWPMQSTPSIAVSMVRVSVPSDVPGSIQHQLLVT